MILFQDLTIIIELQPETNILCVCWLEQQVFRMSDFETGFHILMKNLEKSGTKKMLARSSRNVINLPEEEYISVITLLQSGFAHSQIQKVAHVSRDQSEKYLQYIRNFEHIMNEMQLEIDFRSFDRYKKALDWLKE